MRRTILAEVYGLAHNPHVILLLILGICTGLLARHKGYSFLAWLLAGSLVGIIIITFLPDTIEVKTLMAPEEVNRLRKQGNYIGIAFSLLSLIVGVLIEFNRISTR